jgi:hypothetical protein
MSMTACQVKFTSVTACVFNNGEAYLTMAQRISLGRHAPYAMLFAL